jgi:molybdate transport system substrate-binding protein
MMRRFLPPLFILGLILSACGPFSSAQPTQALMPVAASQPEELYIFAAASLTEPFSELILAFEQSHPDVQVVSNFAGSQQLVQQIAQGAPADVFASANLTQMEAAIQSGRVKAGDERIFVNNRLVVITPADNPGNITSLQDLTKPGLSLILAAEAVPLGKYSLIFLEQASQDPGFGAGYQGAVIENVVSYEENVKAVLSKIILGEADAGIVYTSDVYPVDADRLMILNIPDPLNVQAAYYLAPINDSRASDLAQAFITSVLAPAGQDTLSRYGFLPAQ